MKSCTKMMNDFQFKELLTTPGQADEARQQHPGID